MVAILPEYGLCSSSSLGIDSETNGKKEGKRLQQSFIDIP
jgi:hypothetical protein